MAIDLPVARRDQIAARLQAGLGVASRSLAIEFHVSEDAIRRDLRALAAAGICRRVYGGALPLADGVTPLADRLGVDLDVKRSLARSAIPLLEHGEIIFLDNGSTNVIVADELPHDADLVVATSSIEIAAIVAKRHDLQLLMIGGAFDRMIGGSIDGTALEALARLNIDTCILGVCGLSIGGISALDPADATFKRAIMAQSKRTIVLAATDKIDLRAPHRVAELNAIDHIIIDHDVPENVAAELGNAGARILRADASTDQTIKE